MAKFEEIGVVAVVDGFEAFVLKLTSMNKNVKKFGTAAATAAGGISVLSTVLKTVAYAGAAAVAVIGAIAVGIAKLTASSIQTAASFETAFAGVLKTTNTLGTNLYNLTDAGEVVFQQFRDLAKQIPMSFEELSRIGELAGQLGVPEMALASFTETIAALSVSTDLTAEEATLGLARISNVYGVTADEMAMNTERLGSTITWLGNNFAATEPEILTFARMMAGTAEAVNISQAELLAIGTAFTAAGVNAEAGGSSIQRVLLEMSSAVQRGGKDLRKWATATGLTADEFADAWGTEGGPAKIFNQFVQELAQSGEGASLVLENLDVDTIRVLRTFLAGAGAAENLELALAGATQAWDENTQLAREASIRYETLDSKVQILKNRFRDMGTTLGMMLVPHIESFLDKIGPIIDGIENGIGPAFETIASSIRNNLIPALNDLFFAFTGLSFEQLFAELPTESLAAQMEPGVLEFDTSGADAVASGIENIGKKIADNIESFSTFVDKLSEFVTLSKENGFIEGIVLFKGGTADDLVAIQGTLDGVNVALKILAITLGTIAVAFAIAFVIANPLVVAIGILLGLLISVGPTVRTAFSQLGAIISYYIGIAGTAIANWAINIGLWFTNIGTTIADWATQAGEDIVSWIGTAGEDISTFFTETLPEFFQNAIDTMETWISNFVEAGENIIDGIVEGLNKAGHKIVETIVSYVTDAWNAVMDFFGISSPSKLMAKTVGEPIMEGVAVGVKKEGDAPENAMLQSMMGVVNMADMLLPSNSYTTTSTDRSFNMGDINVTATPEDPMTMADRIAMMAMIVSG